MKSSKFSFPPRSDSAAFTCLLLLGVILLLLWGDFIPGQIQFSNDGPLGRLMSSCHDLPGRFGGCWQDLNFAGYREGKAVPDISFGLQWLLHPILFSKFYAPIALFLLGLSAWCFFRQLRLSPAAANFGAMAAVLNSSFFSAACWGAGPHVITIAMTFLALAALADTSSPRRWLRVLLAGMAVGMAVSEGADIGALFSLLVAAFIVFQAFVESGFRLPKMLVGGVRLLLVAVCAGWLAADAISELVTNDIQGVTSTRTDDKTAFNRWNWATQWSLPKSETLSLVVPGLFGFRDDTLEGGQYWGSIGRDPLWDDYVKNGGQGTPPTGAARFTGGGIYAGVVVALVAAWAGVQSLRGKKSVFDIAECRWLWFWMGGAIVCLLLAYGRFAPFYRWLFALPYASTVRNPAKFTHLLSFAIVVMFAYGVNGLWRRYVRPAATPNRSAKRSFSALDSFDQRWLVGCVVIFGLSVIGCLIYAANRDELEQYLLTVQIRESAIRNIANFSIRQPWWFILFFGASIIFSFYLMRGAFRGERQLWAGVLLGLLLAADLGRANQPWIVLLDYKDKYASDPIIDFLRDKPHEHRVAMVPSSPSGPTQLLRQIYPTLWAQYQFPYYNIQSVDSAMLPRMPNDISLFERTFHSESGENTARLMTRAWELTNTRYLIGVSDPNNTLNPAFDPKLQRYHVIQQFSLVPKPGISRPTTLDDLRLVVDSEGGYSLYEFKGALPRARLYSKWQSSTNNNAALELLASESFDPQTEVVISANGTNDAAPVPSILQTNDLSPVEFVSYSPKDIVLHAEASAPSLLLLNDRYDPGWEVKVDGAPSKLLRCNFVMRGVMLGAGSHNVEFQFHRPLRTLWISLSALATAVLLAGVLIACQRGASRETPAKRREEDQPSLSAKSSPATPSARR